MAFEPMSTVTEVSDVSIQVADAPWPFAEAHRAAIARHWQVRSVENPAMFNGRILILTDWALDTCAFRATAIEVDFADFLYWREHGRPDRTVRHVFGAAALMLSDGGLVTALASAGTINHGQLHFPGGFIDPDDVVATPEGRFIDVPAQIRREMREEVGLAGSDLSFPGQYLIAQVACEIGLIAVVETPASPGDLKHRLAAHNQNRTGGLGVEIDRLEILYRQDDPAIARLVPYAQRAARAVLPPSRHAQAI